MLPGFFFFNDTATTEIYTLSLHDALPILLRYLDYGRTFAECARVLRRGGRLAVHQYSRRTLILRPRPRLVPDSPLQERERTRLESRHPVKSYAVFLL